MFFPSALRGIDFLVNVTRTLRRNLRYDERLTMKRVSITNRIGLTLNQSETSIWECCELLNEFIDESDPDLDEPQIDHLLQIAEAIRKYYPMKTDLGKVLLHPSFGELLNDLLLLQHYGIYTEGCGLARDNVFMSWGRDDYMYLVAKEKQTTLPSAGLFIIRYHSFYALHKSEAYEHLVNDEDRENMKWLKVFNMYDLYSKSKVRINVEEVKPYYISLINKYFPTKLKW
ncbi:hypothetical protein Bca52824_076211 [Brassica carinata]|uniref:Inositol oxygenase n=1 Tax=Brassica carinata TaxID=52824 RepID=A0A8X7PUC5_BRACI|nr:hypothetical protein Bca52824_076211 [Brassica carinata]